MIRCRSKKALCFLIIIVNLPKNVNYLGEFPYDKVLKSLELLVIDTFHISSLSAYLCLALLHLIFILVVLFFAFNRLSPLPVDPFAGEK